MSVGVLIGGAAAASASTASGRDAWTRTMALRGVRDLGRANPNQQMEVTVTFRRQQEAELAQLVLDQSDRSSRSYGR